MSLLEVGTIWKEQRPTVSEPFETPHWYAVYTRSRHEKLVFDQLYRKGVEAFIPVYSTIRRWKNGDHRVEMPLFSGYTFVHIALRDRLKVLVVSGVVRLVSFNNVPAAIDDAQVEGLRSALIAGIKAEPHPYLNNGQHVRITTGPLAGREGILIRVKGSMRVVLSIHLIMRSILVDVDVDAIEPVI